MALEFEEYEFDPEEMEELRQIGRSSPVKMMTTAYTGVGDAVLAQSDLVCGVAEPAGFGLVVPGGAGAHHSVQPEAHEADQR